ncbi:MAG: helix-turn-helix domain-containing protein [Cypionkella sp.]|jgi:AraC family transcriptional regulator, transcriptional activator of pobA
MSRETTPLMSMLRLEAIEPSFRARVYAAGQGAFAGFNFIAILRRGSARLVLDQSEISIGAHCVVAVPHGVSARLELPAGTGLWIIGFSPLMQSFISGTGPESLSLTLLLDRLCLTPENHNGVETSIAPLLPMLFAETSDPDKRSQTAVAALLRLILIAISRMLNTEAVADPRNDSHTLLRFRQLVELGHRSRKPVAQYCAELNLTYDRLHDICQRNLNRSPLVLIRQRVLLDASTRLVQTEESIQSIADHLGFDDPSKFSHFFKRAIGLSPRHYRLAARQEKDLQTRSALQAFSDWP